MEIEKCVCVCFNKVQPELRDTIGADSKGFIFPLEIIIICFKLKDTTTLANSLFKPVVECLTMLNKRRQTRGCSNTDATERQCSAERKEAVAFILGEMGGETSGVIRRRNIAYKRKEYFKPSYKTGEQMKEFTFAARRFQLHMCTDNVKLVMF